MEEKNLKEKLSEHWSKHKVKYMVSGGIVLSLAVGYILGRKTSPKNFVNLEGCELGDGGTLNVAVGDNSNPTFLTVTSVTAGHPGNIIEDPSTGDIWLSQSKAAEALGVSRNTVKRMMDDGKLINHGANTGVSFANSQK